MLSDHEIKYLVEKAESYFDSKDFQQALKSYNQIIENAQPHSSYFIKRGTIWRLMGHSEKAISDLNKAIELDPDNATVYLLRAPCYNYDISQALSYGQELEKYEERKYILKQSLKDYKAAIERDPTMPEAWIAMIGTELRLFNWDDAISTYGSCKPYITDKKYHVIRSWYGCLALTLAGGIIEEEDIAPLDDQSIRLDFTDWGVIGIDIFLLELEAKGFDKNNLQKVKELHQKFLNHFDDPPLRFNPALHGKRAK